MCVHLIPSHKHKSVWTEMMGDHRLIVNTLLFSPLPPAPPLQSLIISMIIIITIIIVAKVSITKFLNLIDSKQP